MTEQEHNQDYVGHMLSAFTAEQSLGILGVLEANPPASLDEARMIAKDALVEKFRVIAGLSVEQMEADRQRAGEKDWDGLWLMCASAIVEESDLEFSY